MKNLSKLLLPVLSITALVGCGPEPLVDVVDVKTAVLALQQADNYLVEVKDEAKNTVFEGQYAENYFYENKSNEGYLLKKKKVYPFHFDNTNIITNEALDVKTLYGENGALMNADDIDLNSIPDAKNTFTTLKRNIAKPLLSMCGFKDQMYGALETLTLEQVNKSLQVTFTFNQVHTGEGLSTYNEVATFTKLRQIKLPLIEDFIKHGKLTEIDKNLLRIRDLFRLDNYTQYQSDGTSDVQVDLFNKQYFATLFTDYAIKKTPVLKMNQSAYLTIIHPNETLDLLKDDKGNAYPLIYDDTYLFQYFGSYESEGDMTIITRPSPKRPGYAEGGFQQVVKDIPTNFHYPKALKVFDNLDLLVPIDGDDGFSVLDKGLIDNILADYSLTGGFDEFGGIVEIQFLYDFKKNDADCKITIRFVAPEGYYDIKYDKFGVTKFKPFEDLLASIN